MDKRRKYYSMDNINRIFRQNSTLHSTKSHKFVIFEKHRTLFSNQVYSINEIGYDFIR